MYFIRNKQSLIKKAVRLTWTWGSLKFTDLLKLCSSTRIFPDLLGSPDLHKVLVEVASDSSTSSISQHLTFGQFETFLHSVAAKAFPYKTDSEQQSLLFMHLKNSCSLRYSVDFETILADKKLNLTKKVPRLNIESAKFQRQTPKTTRQISFKPNSTKNVKSSSFLFRNSPRKNSVDKKKKGHACSIITPRMNNEKNASNKPSPRPILTDRNPKKAQILNSFKSSSSAPNQNKILKLAKILSKYKEINLQENVEKTIKMKKFEKFMQGFVSRSQTMMLNRRLTFKLWALITKRLRFQ